MRDVLCTVALLLLLLPNLPAQEAPPSPQPGELPSGSPKRAHERIKRELSDETGVAPSPAPPHSSRPNPENYRRLKQDADELLRLAAELRHSVEKSNSNALSLDVVNKAEQIEKLAKRVKKAMKNN
jgi:type VI protein secretion system component VasF